jgi:hypothetical protein
MDVERPRSFQSTGINAGELALLWEFSGFIGRHGRPPKIHELSGPVSVARYRMRRLLLRGLLKIAGTRKGGYTYAPAPDALKRAAGLVVYRGRRGHAPDPEVYVATARDLVAEGEYPSLGAVAERLGMTASGIGPTVRRLKAEGRWPAHDIDPRQRNKEAQRIHAAGRRKASQKGPYVRSELSHPRPIVRRLAI